MLINLKKVTRIGLAIATVFATSIVGGNADSVQAAQTVYKAKSYDYITTNDFNVIRTHASNIKAVKINQALPYTDYYGINGGLYNFATKSTPASASNIFWEKSKDGVPNTLNDHNTGYKYRGTLVTYKDPVKGTVAVVKSYTDISAVKSDLGQNLDYRNMLGGGNLYVKQDEATFRKGFKAEGWDSLNHQPDATGANRTGIGVKYENGQSYLYLFTSKKHTSLINLRNTMKALGCKEGIWLDGGHSTQMQVKTSPTNTLKFAEPYEGQLRRIHHAVTLINKN
ncbi:phosphodiester glycosidase family protein [Hazenella sp. IB182357]|uniref:Phosphodiester glycosidase family protein n=1 Tax=Polycladospora coralii TaxID=2771432 RepID=A0A926NAX3_9BACL|nr:phosphodiester glycosidase family protein [Polycladospora coralii]MBD1373521.1 phosphodiester glycosidase family protein [Polycladospora coralii]MBS7531889.1 phosphodiester glycosidase family protein [Polycladospora coralii]